MKIYLVGGAVRDRLLGRKPRERDWVVVGAREKDMIELGFTRVGHAFPVFIDPNTGEEYALARTESKVSSGHKGFDFDTAPSVDLETDLRRRDLTINAMAEENGKLIDPFGGERDLKNRVLRHVSDAFVEDPLRVMRVARLCAELRDFGFEVCDETLDLMRRIAESGELQQLSRERVWTELAKVAETRWLDLFLGILDRAGCLLPWFAECRFSDAQRREFGAWQRRLPASVSRIAALGGLLEPPACEELMRRLGAPRRHARATSIVARQSSVLKSWRREDAHEINAGFRVLRGVKPEQARAEVLDTLALTAGMPHRLLRERLDQYIGLKVDTVREGGSYRQIIESKRLSLVESWLDE